MPRQKTDKGTPCVDLIDRYIIVSNDGGTPDYQYFDNVGEIVRCVECKFYEPRMNRCHEGHVSAAVRMYEQDYCSRAIRRIDGV